MGGIAGVMTFTRGRVDVRRVERMLELLDHRGPDDRGVRRSTNGRLALGGCRSILDEQEALVSIPLTSEADDVWLVLDGTIDNHRALRHSLRLDGHMFRSEAVGEVVVHAYEQYGAAFLDHLHGRFALALWDEHRHRLVLARDRLGERPLYWFRSDGLLAFASEAKALLDALAMPRRLDLNGLNEYLAHGFVLAPNTLFEGVHKLGPGEALVIERGNRAEAVGWWAPCQDERRAAAVRALATEEHESNLRLFLDSAIADRLAANLPIAALIDDEPESLAMAVAMGRLLGRPVEAVVLGEAAAGRLAPTATAAGLKVVPVTPGDAQMTSCLTDYVRAMDEPSADPAAVPMWWLARGMSNCGLAVGLSSAGAGAVLLGSELLARHRAAPARALRALPAVVRRMGLALLAPLLTGLGRRGAAETLRLALDMAPLPPAPQSLFAEPGHVLTPEARSLTKARPPGEALARTRHVLPPWIAGDTLASLAFMEVRTALAEGRLMTIDRMTMAHSVDVRLPFVDDAVVDYSLAIASGERAAGGRPKDLLLRAVHDLLSVAPPPPVQAAAEPAAARWFRGPLAGIFEDTARRGGMFQRGVLDGAACRGLLAEHQAGGVDHHHRLWSLLVLSQWFDLHGVEAPGAMQPESARQAAVG